MEFDRALYNRRNTFSWSDKVPSGEQIDEILTVLHDCSPSKQSRARYKLDVIRNDSEYVKMEIYKGACVGGDRNENGGKDNQHITNAELSLADCKQIFEQVFLRT